LEQLLAPPISWIGWRAPDRTVLAANSFAFRRALRCGSRSRIALRRGSRLANRLGLGFPLGLRIADRLGQHRMQLGLGALLRFRVTVFCHSVLAVICRRTSPLLLPGAQPSIVRNFSEKLPALVRTPSLRSIYWSAEKSFQPLVARGFCLFYRSWITSNFSDR
jgi:hypothetical protein